MKPCHRRDHDEVIRLRGELAKAHAHHEAATIRAARLEGKVEALTAQLEQTRDTNPKETP